MATLQRQFYVWIDPPGESPGWIYTCTTDAQVAEAMAQHDIPENNDELRSEYEQTHAGQSVERYQAERDHWGVTVLDELPDDLPEKIVMVATK